MCPSAEIEKPKMPSLSDDINDAQAGGECDECGVWIGYHDGDDSSGVARMTFNDYVVQNVMSRTGGSIMALCMHCAGF